MVAALAFAACRKFQSKFSDFRFDRKMTSSPGARGAPDFAGVTAA
jgi:hypothetical protein